MTVRVIVPPDPIVTPEDIAGSHGNDDARVAALIQAVTEGIDGPSGWVGRSFGFQVLRLTMPEFCGRNLLLPYGPVVQVTSVIYLDANGDEQTLPDTDYRVVDDRIWFASNLTFPTVACQPDAIRIEYEAGYNDEAITNGGTGPVPERARQAIIQSVQYLKAQGDAENLFLRSQAIEGVETVQYTVTDQAAALVRSTTERLLSTLVVQQL